VINWETLNLLSAARPDHGIKKAVDAFLKIQEKKELKKQKPQGEQVGKYTSWITKQTGINTRNDSDFTRSC
jgi:hypothetical protein